MWRSLQLSNVSIFILWNKFSEKRKLFSKDWNIVYLVERTKIENKKVSYKTVLSEANEKTNKMGNTKWIYHKVWSFASSNFLKILFQFYNFTAKSWFDVPPTQMSIFILFESAEVLFEVSFPNKSIEILRCASGS